MAARRSEAAASVARDLAVAASRAEPLEPLLPAVVDVLRADAGIGLTRIARAADGSGRVEVSVSVSGTPPPPEEVGRRAVEVAARHPGLLTLSAAHATRVSDLVHLPDFWCTEVYERMHGHADGRYPMAALLHGSPDELIFLGLHRSRRDFDDDDVRLLEQLQRPLVAALAFRSALDATTALLCGEHLRATPHGPPLLARPAPPPSPEEDYRPTAREAEVLTLAAAGWTNHRIARRLGISERTVRKHLGSVYERSGQHGRAAASAWWGRRHETRSDP
ncbi:helix-turn-helix transcriptional regulator [Terrabacter sp. NPDC000476]|uniref:helix-turn-helix transcriptional regulator n=1 Tax=Terrabacter sp. NPDC000476 TaxID=3154258 RepID=UPI00332F551C